MSYEEENESILAGLSKKQRRRIIALRSTAWDLESGKLLGTARHNADPAKAQNITHYPVSNDFRKLMRNFRRWVEARRR